MTKANGKNAQLLRTSPQLQLSLPFADQNSDPVPGNASPLKILRQAKGLTQRMAAQKIGIERTRLVRLERKVWSQISLGELEIVSQGLGVSLEELISHFNGFKKQVVTRSSLEKPCFIIDLVKGVRFASCLAKPDLCFIGMLTLGAQKSLPKEEAPQGELLFYFVLEGTLLVNLLSKEHVLKKGDSISIEKAGSYELYNPHQFQDLVAVLFATPSFIRSSPLK